MTATAGYLVREGDVDPRRDPDDTAEERVTIDASAGCVRLEQRVVRFGPGRSAARTLDGVQEVLYVHSGTGTLRLGGGDHALAPGTAVFIVDG